jgi:shikimate kinase
MRIILITGASGSGKSTLAQYLRQAGHQAVSLDGYPGLCDWVDLKARPVPWPHNPSANWIEQHRWIWHADILDDLIAKLRESGAGVAFLTGRADNAHLLRDRFDAVILLRLDKQTMLQRLHSHERANPFGRMGDSRDHLESSFEATQHDLGTLADAVVDACRPVGLVADDVLAAAALAVLRKTRPATGR